MGEESPPNIQPTRARIVFASIVVALTVVGVWKFIDYRTQPPPPPTAVTSDK
jgi:hypothetical protein